MAAEEKYMINPTLMMGTVKSVDEELLILNLRGRLGLITVPTELILSKEGVETGVSWRSILAIFRPFCAR